MTCFIGRNDVEYMMKSVVLLAFSLCFLFLSICVKEKGKAFSDFPLMQIYTFKKANANPLWITFTQEFIILLSSSLFWQSLLCGMFAGWISRIVGFKASFNCEIPNDKWVISCCIYCSVRFNIFFFFLYKIFCDVNRCEYLCHKIICIHKDLCNNIMLEIKTIISGNDENAPMGEL